MYYPIGWPKILDVPFLADNKINQIVCDRVKILFAVLTDESLSIWFTKPSVPIVFIKRDAKSLSERGRNYLVEWKPDSSMLVIATTDGTLVMYALDVIDSARGVFNQIDSPNQNLRRDSAELFVKETIPALQLTKIREVCLYVPVTCISCVSVSQMMIATVSSKVLRIRWDGVEERDYSLDLKRIPFSINQQVSYAVPIVENNVYINSMDYSPLLGGFGITLNDGRAAFLTANNLKFDPNQVQGIWAQNVDDATCVSVNHKYRLIAFGRKTSQGAVYTIDDVTGGLELSHTMILSAKDFPGSPGFVKEMRWTPDGCAIIMSWSTGGISLWSTFGAMLMCSLVWDYGLDADLTQNNPLDIDSMDWSTEGYQLLMVRKQKRPKEETVNNNNNNNSHNNTGAVSDGLGEHSQIADANPIYSLLQLDFVKSSLTVNPCMSVYPHLLLQGDDKLYINHGDGLQNIYQNCKIFNADACNSASVSPAVDQSSNYLGANNNTGNIHSSYNVCTNSYINGKIVTTPDDDTSLNIHDNCELGNTLQLTSMLSESKHWIVIQLPIAYIATNWPIRYSALDTEGLNLAIAGRTGFAIYSILNRKWKLFGNETQEKDFIVTAGLLWWQGYVIMGSYSLIDQNDELRLYPLDCKLDNRFGKIIGMGAPVMLINSFKEQLIVFTADGFVTIFAISRYDSQNIDLLKIDVYDIRGLCVHPACIVSVTMTNLRNESTSRTSQPCIHLPETIILNASGRLLMVQKENNGNGAEHLTSTCLASCVECIWLSDSKKTHLKESLWLYCGCHGMRVWLPVFPRESDNGHRSHRHTFMSKRIMLSFALKIYPLAILFEDAIILGVENDAVLYTSDSSIHFSLPFCVLERTSQVYLHQILRQLIRRNLGYNAWEIARSCTNLPYFPHSLELLLHEVLEEEATSKEPIPDALLPSVLEFIQEFPVYLQTVVQCARKTEIALWPYLFATAGKPKELFQQCLASKQLDAAASYLIILQNLEASVVSRQYATLLLDTALEQKKWDLAKDLVRFLRAIDPNDVESPRTSFVLGSKFGITSPATPVSPNAEDLSLILGGMTRGRSFSTTMNPKQMDGINTPTNVPKDKTPLATKNMSVVQRRKKSVPHTQKEKDSSTAEEFFIDVILQRHARRLLQQKNLEDLGFMSAALDFHLVGWLSREKDRAARIEDFVSALKQLHDDLNWPRPSGDLNGDDKGSTEESPTFSLQSLRIDTNMGTVDSGYTSLLGYIPTIETPPILAGVAQMDQRHNMTTLYDPILSKMALENMNISQIMNSLPSSVTSAATANSGQDNDQFSKVTLRSITEQDAVAHCPTIDTASIASEQVSLWFDDNLTLMNQEIENQRYNKSETEDICERKRSVASKPSHKLEMKLRYLLQIFTEAGCLEFSLLLSILLHDAASICRITNTAIRTGSLATCRQLRNGLKDVTRWSFQECLGYRPFMIALQSQVAMLDKFVIQQESIPNFSYPVNVQRLNNVGGGSRDDVGQMDNASDDQSMQNTQLLSINKKSIATATIAHQQMERRDYCVGNRVRMSVDGGSAAIAGHKLVGHVSENHHQQQQLQQQQQQQQQQEQQQEQQHHQQQQQQLKNLSDNATNAQTLAANDLSTAYKNVPDYASTGCTIM